MPGLVDQFILPRTAVVIAGACIGTGLALLIPSRPSLGRLRWPLIAAGAAAVVAAIFSLNVPHSLVGSYTRYESLPVRLAYLGLFAVPVWLLRDDRSRDRVTAAFVAGTAIASLEAIWQQISGVDFRPDGNVGNAGLLAALIAMAVPLAITRALRGSLFTVAWWLSVVAMLGGLLVSTSRAGLLGVIAGVLVLVVMRFRGRVAAYAVAAAAAAVALALAGILASPLRELNGDPGPTRLHLWSDGLGAVLGRPITGWGEDSTGLALGHFLTGRWSAPDVTFDRVHNGMLDLAVTQGLLGLITLGVVVGIVAQGAWKHRFAHSVAPLAAACTGYTVWVLFNFDWAPATGAFWLLLGTCWSGVRADAPGPVAALPFNPGPVARTAGAVALALVAAYLAAGPVLADAWYAQGRLDRAVWADPLQAQYRRALGEALISRGQRQDGVQELRLAANLGVDDPGMYVELGDQELILGNPQHARADYERALAIDPFWEPAQQRLAGSGGLATG